MNDMLNTHSHTNRKSAPFDIFCSSNFSFLHISIGKNFLRRQNMKYFRPEKKNVENTKSASDNGKSKRYLEHRNTVCPTHRVCLKVVACSFIIEQYIIFNTDVISFCLIYPHQRVYRLDLIDQEKLYDTKTKLYQCSPCMIRLSK